MSPPNNSLYHFAACGYSLALATTAARGQSITQGYGMRHGHIHIANTRTLNAHTLKEHMHLMDN